MKKVVFGFFTSALIICSMASMVAPSGKMQKGVKSHQVFIDTAQPHQFINDTTPVKSKHKSDTSRYPKDTMRVVEPRN